MKYTTEDAISLSNMIRANAEVLGEDTVFTSLTQADPELLALTLMLTTLSQ